MATRSRIGFWIARAATAIGLIAIAWIGWVVWWLFSAVPNVDTDYAARFEALALKGQFSGDNAIGTALEIDAIGARIDQLLSSKYGTQGNAPAEWPRVHRYLLDLSVLDRQDLTDETKLVQSIAAEYFAEIERSEIPSLLRKLVASGAIWRHVEDDGLLHQTGSTIGRVRELARYQQYVAQRGADAADWNRVCEALTTIRALGGLRGREPRVLGRLTGNVVDVLSYAIVSEVVQRYEVPSEVMLKLASLFSQDAIARPLSEVLDGEELVVMDVLQRTHDKSGRFIATTTRLFDDAAGRTSRFMNIVGFVMPSREAGERQAKGLFDRWRAEVQLAPHDWRGSGRRFTEFDDAENRVLASVLPQVGTLWRSEQGVRVRLGGTRLIIALERCRLARGKYPEKLDELVPEFLPGVPEDPYFEKGFVYKRGDDPSVKGSYTLYSVGDDGEDNGGLRAEHEYDALVPAGKGTDFVFMPPSAR